MRRQFTIVIEPKNHEPVKSYCADPAENEGHYFIVRERYLSDSEYRELMHNLRYNQGIKDFRVHPYKVPNEAFQSGLGDLPLLFKHLDPDASLRAPSVRSMAEEMFVPLRSPRRENIRVSVTSPVQSGHGGGKYQPKQRKRKSR